jgi:hypothetical protein
MPIFLTLRRQRSGRSCFEASKDKKKKKKKTHHKKRAGGVTQGVGPEFKPQHCKQTNKQTKD